MVSANAISTTLGPIAPRFTSAKINASTVHVLGKVESGHALVKARHGQGSTVLLPKCIVQRNARTMVHARMAPAFATKALEELIVLFDCSHEFPNEDVRLTVIVVPMEFVRLTTVPTDTVCAQRDGPDLTVTLTKSSRKQLKPRNFHQSSLV